MRRFQIPSAALVAGLAILLSGCSGETPTAPSSGGGNGGNGGGGNGSCTVLVSMSATTQSPLVGTAAIVRATVTRAGVPIPDGGSVQFTTDLGFFGENGLNTISKTTVGGVADVTVVSNDAGTAHVKALFDCANAQINLNFGGIPDTGPFISSLTPTTGSCAGGDLVTILGGRFTGTSIDVFFGGVRGSIRGAVTDTQIVVSTPARTLRDSAVPETVDVVVRVNGASSAPKSFTYACIPINQRIFISSIVPTEGTSAGGDLVTINGGNFGSNIATTRVTFCGRPAQITAQQDQQITVTTPASPLDLEVCDVVVTRDLGLVSQQSATAPQQFTFRRVLTPVINSVSPRTGPNDASTRVTIFGSGFQFPLQVFMTGGTCGAQRVEAAVSDISLTTIVFKTPIATNNVCLMNQLVDIEVLNPTTGKKASCPACFKFYSCPTSGSAAPSSADGTVPTTVVISGANFESPITANFKTVNDNLIALNVTSVSANAIVLTMPPASQLLGGSPACADITGNIEITFLGLTCAPIQVPFRYHLSPPFASTAGPNNLSQDGSPFPATGAPATITVTGGNFTDPMTVQLVKDGSVVANTLVNNANVANVNTLTFVAPAVLDSSLNKQNCTLGGTISGTQLVPTSFGIRLTSTRTGCTTDLPNVLVYHPLDPTCK